MASKQTFCLTPQHDTDKLLLTAGDSSPPIFAISFGVSMSLCKETCSAQK